ncbi:hypothetical protein [Allofustis seminis]|uniref:hypothetical protein n=1 Tax=Allofustis seminis TaxID=166939 RepID=UPI00036BD7F6|nr:hypothetical protein [Allofustis seminis]
MNYKKIMTLAAVSIFALSACGKNDKKDDATDKLMDQAENAEKVTPDTGLTLVGGKWTPDGYIFGGPEKVKITGQVLSDGEFSVYLLDDEGKILQKVAEPEFAFEVDAPSDGATNKYVVGVSKDDLGAEGDKVDDVEKFGRYEHVTTEKVEQAPEAE